MEKYEAIIQLISENPESVEFADFGNGCSEFWIKRAQDTLQVTFPPSYIWWLKNYSGGEVFGDEIFSVYEIEDVVGGDIIYMNKLYRKEESANETQLIIQTNDRAETYYFNLKEKGIDDEYPVYVDFCGNKRKYADDFLSFLVGRILDKY